MPTWKPGTLIRHKKHGGLYRLDNFVGSLQYDPGEIWDFTLVPAKKCATVGTSFGGVFPYKYYDTLVPEFTAPIDFVRLVTQLKTEDEYRLADRPPSHDRSATLNGLIEMARKIEVPK